MSRESWELAPGKDANGLLHAEPPPQPRAAPVHDGLAIASLVLSIVWLGGLGSVLGAVFGHMSLAEAKRSHRPASALAVTGTVLGWLGMAAGVIALVLVLHARSGSGQMYGPGGSYNPSGSYDQGNAQQFVACENYWASQGLTPSC